MHFWIFSFNRGQFLRNCVESIERCAPGCLLTVFDDDSDDAETVGVLAWVAERHAVVYPDKNGEESKHGGLYNNMQAAFEVSNDDLVCFLQDDTQLVRRISDRDINELKQFFITNKKAGFVQPAFLRGRNKKTDKKLTRYIESKHVYYVDRYDRAAGAYYSDICIFSPQRLKQVGWQFAVREASNEQLAREHFDQLAYWAHPFAAWLPNVPAYRGKTQNWALKKAHQLNASGFYPVDILEGSALKKLLNRSFDEIPYAEDFLSAPGNFIEPWIYYPLQNKKWLKKLSNLEASCRSLFKDG